MRDYVADWADASREFILVCDASGLITWLDARAERQLSGSVGRPFVELAAAGSESKAAALLERGRREPVHDSEVPLVTGGRVLTACFHARPDPGGGVALLGALAPLEHAGALAQMQASMAEVVELNRQVLRQKRDIERQKAELEATHRDLGESNRAVLTLHAELADRAASLERAADVKGRVLATVSHEFRTPLHTIMGLSGILLDASNGPLTEEQRKQVRHIRTSAEELHALVNDLLDLSRAEAGKAQLRLEKLGLRELFAAMRGQMRPLVNPSQPVELIFEAPEDLTLETDHGKLAQVLRNLISNALKFTERGAVRVTARREGERVALGVADTGIGIAEEHFTRVFEEFGQIEGPLQQKVKGTGLGLPLAARLAALLDGELALQSRVGQGSTFTLTIPIAHPEATELGNRAERPLEPARAPVLMVGGDREMLDAGERSRRAAGAEAVPSKENLSRGLALDRIRGALGKAGVTTSDGS